MKNRKQCLAFLLLCLTALSVDGRTDASPRDVGVRQRIHKTIVKVVRVVRAVATGDGLCPPFPSPNP